MAHALCISGQKAGKPLESRQCHYVAARSYRDDAGPVDTNWHRADPTWKLGLFQWQDRAGFSRTISLPWADFMADSALL